MDPMDLPIICYMPKDRRNPASTFLMKFARNVTSQNGEDGIIEKLLELIGATNEWVVEIGAWDGKHLSNSWNLINRKRCDAIAMRPTGLEPAMLRSSSRPKRSCCQQQMTTASLHA
jgi:hypothetical protein